jgi:hypothetical protein
MEEQEPAKPETPVEDGQAEADQAKTINGVPVEDTVEPLDWLEEGEVVL